MEQRMDREAELLERIERLEAENRRLRERENDSVSALHSLIRKLPAPAVAVGEGSEILVANEPFLREGGYRTRRLADEAPALAGVAVGAVLPEELCVLVEAAHGAGEDTERFDTLWNGELYTFSAFHIRRGRLTIVLLRPLAAAEIPVDELTERLQQEADRNVPMIQQIAFLLGAEASESAKTIGSVIRALKAAREPGGTEEGGR